MTHLQLWNFLRKIVRILLQTMGSRVIFCIPTWHDII